MMVLSLHGCPRIYSFHITDSFATLRPLILPLLQPKKKTGTKKKAEKQKERLASIRSGQRDLGEVLCVVVAC